MSDPIVVPARLERGKLSLNRKRLAEELRGKRDGDYLLTIERAHATRSLQANAWYWGVILPALAEATGYTVDEVHEFCKLRFNPKRVIVTNEAGEIVAEEQIGLTTTRLNKLTFGEYCEAIRQWAALELGIDIPDPDPLWREHAAEAAHV